MPPVRNCFIAIYLGISLMSVAPISGHALMGLVTGSVLLKQAGNEFDTALGRAETAANSLLKVSNKIAKDRLNQIDKIINTTAIRLINATEQSALKIIEEATANIKELEEKTISDLGELLFKAECSGRVLALEDAREALGGVARFLNTHTIKLEPYNRVIPTPGVLNGCFWNCDPYTVKISTPFDRTYEK